MRINKRDEFDANIDHWMNLDHLQIHIVKVPLTDQVLTYRGRSIKDIETDPYLLSLSSASGAKNRKLFVDKFVRKISKYDVDYVITNPHYKNSNEKFLYAAIKEYSNKFSRIYGENDNSLRIFKINKYSEL